jgi:hypothetical protein
MIGRARVEVAHRLKFVASKYFNDCKA